MARPDFSGSATWPHEPPCFTAFGFIVPPLDRCTDSNGGTLGIGARAVYVTLPYVPAGDEPTVWTANPVLSMAPPVVRPRPGRAHDFLYPSERPLGRACQAEQHGPPPASPRSVPAGSPGTRAGRTAESPHLAAGSHDHRSHQRWSSMDTTMPAGHLLRAQWPAAVSACFTLQSAGGGLPPFRHAVALTLVLCVHSPFTALRHDFVRAFVRPARRLRCFSVGSIGLF
jgi:hypothetical protein